MYISPRFVGNFYDKLVKFVLYKEHKHMKINTRQRQLKLSLNMSQIRKMSTRWHSWGQLESGGGGGGGGGAT